MTLIPTIITPISLASAFARDERAQNHTKEQGAENYAKIFMYRG